MTFASEPCGYTAPMPTDTALRSAAGAARAESRALRAESEARRRMMRRSLDAVERRRGACEVAFSGLDGRELQFRSPWSDLVWRSPGMELDRVLVSHDGEI
jgi:hypothetical protein